MTAKYRSDSLKFYLERPQKSPRVQDPEGAPLGVHACPLLLKSGRSASLPLRSKEALSSCSHRCRLNCDERSLHSKLTPGVERRLGAAPKRDQSQRAVTSAVMSAVTLLAVGLVLEEVVSLMG